MDKEKLLKDICEWYNYEFDFIGGNLILDGYAASKEQLKKLGYSDRDNFHFEYNNIDEMLLDWIGTLEETNKEEVEWKEDTINFIKSLKR